MKNLDHEGIIKLLEYGRKGICVKPEGTVFENLVYMVMEYAKGEILFDYTERMKDENRGMEEYKAKLIFK